MAPRDEDDVAVYEGYWSRLLCPACAQVFEVEDDVSNGQEVACDACDWTGPVANR